MDDKHTAWRKSTRSASQSNCVEVAATLDALRDRKNTGGPVLRVDLVTFLTQVKAGRFDV